MEYILESMEQLLKTFDGTTAVRKECRFIKGNYYIKNKQCFYIDEKWYRINSGLIFFDYYDKTWKLKKSVNQILNGIVDLDAFNEYIFGEYSKTDTPLYVFYKGSLKPVMSQKLIDNNPNICEGLNGMFYHKNEKNLPKEFTTKLKPRRDNYYSIPFHYSSDELLGEFSKAFKKSFKQEKLLSDSYIYLERDNFTFGIEFETEKGAIPEKFLLPNGLIPCRDGSISGFEYVTIPLSNAIGIQTIKQDCALLQKYCSCSPTESLHVHFGSYPKTFKAIASLYRLGCLIQSEIYKLFPYYYKDTSAFKRKGYCNPLPILAGSSKNPMEIFEDLFYFLSGERTFSGKFPTGNHPQDAQGNQKWNITGRYLWLNFIPLIWGKRETIEFRCHTPTLNSQKVINWIFLLNAVLRYAVKNQDFLTTKTLDDLPNIKLEEIISDAYPTHISSILIEYIKYRRKHYAAKNDLIGEMEVKSEETGVNLFPLKEFV